MLTIGLSEEESLLFVARVAAHLPIGAGLGRVVAVSSEGILTGVVAGASATYGLHLGDDYAWRLVPVSPGRCELTCWRHGEELERRVIDGRLW